VSNYLIAGVEPGAHGNENVTSAPSGAFETAEGLLNIAANKDEQWLMLARILGREDLQKNPSYTTREDRKRNRTELKKELEAVLRTRPARDWEPELNQAGVPAGEVLTVPDILAAQQVIERAFLTDFDEVTGLDRAIRLATCGVLLNDQRPRPSSAPPTLGADNEAIWKEIGISDRELRDFRTRGTI
jgi:crotonobetainyl-CoA:carnitine CoA-transferase CaiB-like acyl-CoA transferase